MSNESPLLIAGFDISCNSTGICIINDKKNIVHAESINPYPLDGIQRLNYIYDRFHTVLISYPINIVGFEEQVQQQRYSYSAGSMLPLAEVFGAFKVVLHKTNTYHNASIYSFKPQVLKRTLSGDPKADKDKMMESLGTRRLNHLKSNIAGDSVNDCADAYAAALAALQVHTGVFQDTYSQLVSTV